MQTMQAEHKIMFVEPRYFPQMVDVFNFLQLMHDLYPYWSGSGTRYSGEV